MMGTPEIVIVLATSFLLGAITALMEAFRLRRKKTLRTKGELMPKLRKKFLMRARRALGWRLIGRNKKEEFERALHEGYERQVALSSLNTEALHLSQAADDLSKAAYNLRISLQRLGDEDVRNFARFEEEMRWKP